METTTQHGAIAVTKAKREYDTFNRTQRIESDFDKAIKQLQLFDN